MEQPPDRQTLAVFRSGDVSLEIWMAKTSRAQIMTTIRKNVHPDVIKAMPELAHTFTSQDISAIRKLTEEAEDALFNYQSWLAQQVDPTRDQAETSSEEGRS